MATIFKLQRRTRGILGSLGVSRFQTTPRPSRSQGLWAWGLGFGVWGFGFRALGFGLASHA